MNPRAFWLLSAGLLQKKKLCAGRLWVATCDVTSFLRMDSTVLQGFGHSRGLRCGMAHRQADQQTETALTDAHTTSLARCWAGLRPRWNADSRPQTDGQTNRCTDRFTDARTAQHSPLLFFLCRGRRSCVFSARTIVVPPPPLSAGGGLSSLRRVVPAALPLASLDHVALGCTAASTLHRIGPYKHLCFPSLYVSETNFSHGGGEGCAPVAIFSPPVGRLARLWILYPCPHTTGVECRPQRTRTLHVVFFPPSLW